MDQNAPDIARRLARQAEAVCRHYLSSGHRQGRYWVVGDVSNAKGRSLYVRLTGPDSGPGAAGKWTDAATGEHGDLLDLIAANLRLSSLGETLDEARRFLSLPSVPISPSEAQRSVPPNSGEAARRLWAMGKPVPGTLAERYLAGRAITGVDTGSALRFHPRCYYRRAGHASEGKPESWPALLAKVTDIKGRLTGVHRTWLDPVTAGKAPIDPPRKALGHLLGHGVRFGAPLTVLGAAEGLENVLSLRSALPGLPAVAALSAPHLAALVLPRSVTRLYIALDADAPGHRAAARLAARVAAQGVETIQLTPQNEDMNADLRGSGLGALRDYLRAQLAPDDIPALLASLPA